MNSGNSNTLKIDYSCKACNKTYKDASGLWRHNKQHHTPIQNQEIQVEEKKHLCKKCNKELANRISRWRHEKICKVQDESAELKQKIEQMAKSIESLQKNTQEQPADNWESTEFFQFNKVKLIPRKSDCYIDVVPICTSTSTSLDTWLSFESTKTLITHLLKSIPIYKLMYNESDSKIYTHPELAKQLVAHANPLYAGKFTKWIDNLVDKAQLLIDSDAEDESEPEEIPDSSNPYPPNVLYILTNEFNKTNRTYIVGKTQNLKARLCSYNKSAEHEVVYYKQCSPQVLKLCESMLLKKLAPYRVAINRDRFVLPGDKTIDWFTQQLDEAIKFFE